MSNHTRLIPASVALLATVLATGCTTGAVPSTAPSATVAAGTATTAATLNGTYRWTHTQEDADKAGDAEAAIPGQYPKTTTITLKDGELEGGCFGAAGGTYKVAADRITFHSREYDDEATVTFTVDAQGNMHLTPVQPMDPGTAFECFSQPWTKIE